MAGLTSFSKRTYDCLPNMTTVPLPGRPPKDLHVASEAPPSDNAALFRAPPAVTGLVKMEAVSILCAVGILRNKAPGLDSNLCGEHLQDGPNRLLVHMEGKVSWAAFQRMEISFHQKAARSTVLTAAQPNPALSERIQGSISFLRGLKECAPGAS